MFRILTALALVLPLVAQTPTIDQMLSMKSVARPRISPDARFVAYDMTETDWKENAYVTHLWLADTQTGRSFQLTRGKKSSGAAQWSADGRWLAFLTEREAAVIEPLADPGEKKEEKKDEGKPVARQIWLISPGGGEAWQLTKHGAEIDSFRWSEDGRRIAFTAPMPESSKAKSRKEKYADFEIVEQDFDQNQLWIADVAAAEKDHLPIDAKQLVRDPKLNVSDIAWSPDGSKIAFSATSNPLLAFDATSDIFIVDATGENSVKRVVALEGPDGDPHFSPDGSELVFSTALAQKYHYYTNGHVARVRVADVLAKPAAKPADVDDLTASFDEDVALLDDSKQGIFFRAQQKTATHLFRIDPKTLAITRVTAPDAFYLNDVSFDHDFNTIAYTASDPNHVAEVYVSALPIAGAAKKLTDMTAQFTPFKLGTVELISWKSKDAATIEGVLHKPANYDASKKYPLLVVIHGGPTGVSRPTFAPATRTYPIELFLAKGALVLEPNYRGSAGYGAQFRALNVRNLGIGDMWDVMSGVDALVARGIVDETKLGSMGWSQGGYISAFLTTNTDRFKAISVGAGISDWMTYYVNTDVTPFTRQYLLATPWDDPKIYADTSPITNIKKAKTPTLIQHGSNDKRVPPPNAFELYRGLQDAGVPSELILYTGFGHGITKPKSNRAVLQHNLDWFSHYIWAEPIAADSPLNR
ncbi:MAG TPA: S9 family peptidase [Thermoanaerobaculia bacterium]|nr:S9 family peptidase [Thermoanaerobaculia bacterium]